MRKDRFLQLIDELLELEPGTLKGSEYLEAVGWSSLSVIGFMALVDEQFGATVAPGRISQCKVVDDLVALLDDQVIVSDPV